MGIITGVGSPGSVGPTSGGKVIGSNTVSTVFTQVIGANTSRQSITFHNPGLQNLFVGPMLTAAGAANTPTNAAPGGAFEILPGAVMTFTGECQGAWGAFAAANANNPITIMDSNL